MTVNNIIAAGQGVSSASPLIHCITNPISINQCANAVLAVGARPIMAEHPREVAEITTTAQALMLNLGNITNVRMESMLISAETASKNNIPYVLDIVGVACSELRREFAVELIQKARPGIIKGNYSEINALYNAAYKSSGIDSDLSDETLVSNAATALAKQYGSIILASGKTDIITDGKRVIYIKNGTPQLASITGTGCMLGALCACYLSVAPPLDAAACACATLGICGELSKTDKGSGSFMVSLMDNLSVLSDKALKKYVNLEENEIETH